MNAQALICDEQQDFSIENVILADHAPDQIAIRTLHTGVSIGTEFALIRGKLSWGPFPVCTGYMGAGVVEAVGADIDNFSVGDEVYFRGNNTMALGLIVLLLFSMRTGSDRAGWNRERPAGAAPDRPAADNALAVPSPGRRTEQEDGLGGDAGGAGDIDELHMIRDEAASIGTAADVARKRFPVISNPRGAELERVAEQSIEETIADLGDPMSRIYSSIQSGIGDGPPWRMGGYRGIPHQVHVLRVIEEGRADPQKVAELLRRELKVAASRYLKQKSEVNNLFTARMRAIEGGEQASHVPPKMPTKTYGHAGYSALYCLANIGELRPPAVLTGWLERPGKPADPWDIDIWLIDQYFRQASVADTPAAARHAELSAGLKLDDGRIRQSRWNAMWSVHDITLQMKDVDVSDIATIEVLSLPEGLEVGDSQRWQIHKNCLEHSRASR